MFSKAVNGTYYVVEAVPDTSKHMTYITSAYMTKNKPTGSSSANVQAPASTSETSTTISVGNSTVPQSAANVNAEGVETRLPQTAETVCDATVTPDAVKQAINDNTENGGYIGISRNPTPARWKRCISENYKYFPLTGKNNVEQPEQTSGLLHCILHITLIRE